MLTNSMVYIFYLIKKTLKDTGHDLLWHYKFYIDKEFEPMVVITRALE